MIEYQIMQQAAIDAKRFDCGARITLEDDQYVQVWICPDSPEDSCVVLQLCYVDGTIKSQRNTDLGRLDADLIEAFIEDETRW